MSSPPPHCRWLSLPLLPLALLLPGSAVAQAVDAPPERASFAYTRDPNAWILRFREQIGALRDPDPGPSLTIYGDGRLLVHYPDYMARAGNWSAQLDGAELDQLLRSLLDRGMMEFDATRAKQAKRQRDTQRRAGDAALPDGRPVLFAASDESSTVLELRLDRYRPAGAVERRGVEKRIDWHGLRADTKQYPALTEVQDLAAVQRQLLALMRRDDLQEVE